MAIDFSQIAAPRLRIHVGNSLKSVELPGQVTTVLLVSFSERARHAIIEASQAQAQAQPVGIQIKFATSEFWEPDTFGFHNVLSWLATTQVHNGEIQLNQLTDANIQYHQISPYGARNLTFQECLRVHEALLILEGDHILAHQIVMRRHIVNVVAREVLTPQNFVMLVQIFRAEQSSDVPLVAMAFAKTQEQMQANQLPFMNACAVYGMIICSQVYLERLPLMRKALLKHLAKNKITPVEVLAVLVYVSPADSALAYHAMRVFFNNSVEGDEENVELDRIAARNPRFVAAIGRTRAERHVRTVSGLVNYQGTDLPSFPPMASSLMAAAQANMLQSVQRSIAHPPNTNQPPNFQQITAQQPITQPIVQPNGHQNT